MKKLLLLFAIVSITACSSDDAEPVSNGISFEYVGTQCPLQCNHVYTVKNTSNQDKFVTFEVTFENYDEQWGGNTTIAERGVDANSEEEFTVHSSVGNTVSNIEILEVVLWPLED